MASVPAARIQQFVARLEVAAGDLVQIVGTRRVGALAQPLIDFIGTAVDAGESSQMVRHEPIVPCSPRPGVFP